MSEVFVVEGRILDYDDYVKSSRVLDVFLSKEGANAFIEECRLFRLELNAPEDKHEDLFERIDRLRKKYKNASSTYDNFVVIPFEAKP